MKTLILIPCLFASLFLHAQLPSSDVYVGDLKVVKGLSQTSQLEALTLSPQYDNQPSFLADGQHLLLTSGATVSGQEQTDSFVF